MPTTSREALASVPYLKNLPGDDRYVSLGPFWDAETAEWFLYVPDQGNGLQRVAGGESVFGTYLGSSSNDPARDLEFPLGTLLLQHLSFHDVAGPLAGLKNDIHNLAAVMEKYGIITRLRHEKPIESVALITSEVEYLFVLVRSMYDLLHDISKAMCNRIVVLATSERASLVLRDSFRSVVLSDNTPRSKDDIIERWHLPEPLAAFYADSIPDFVTIRQLRDGITHGDRSAPLIFPAPKGLALDYQLYPWKALAVWQHPGTIDGEVGSLRAVFAYLASKALDLLERYRVALTATISNLPAATSPDLRTFLRGPFSHHLLALPETLASPWEE